jgi:hypothetical protein
MTKSHRLAVSLVASILVAGWTLTASATDLSVQPGPPANSAQQVTPPPVTPPPKVVTLTHKKPVHHHFIRVASAEVVPFIVPARYFFPLILGIGF